MEATAATVAAAIVTAASVAAATVAAATLAGLCGALLCCSWLIFTVSARPAAGGRDGVVGVYALQSGGRDGVVGVYALQSGGRDGVGGVYALQSRRPTQPGLTSRILVPLASRAWTAGGVLLRWETKRLLSSGRPAGRLVQCPTCLGTGRKRRAEEGAQRRALRELVVFRRTLREKLHREAEKRAGDWGGVFSASTF